MSSSDRIVELINSASISNDSAEKLEALKIVQELLVHKEPNLLDNFLDEVMGFQKDRNQDVRKFVVGFIEEACKKDPDVLPKVIANLQMLMSDSAVVVQKRVIQAMTHLYKVALTWLAKAKVVTEDMEAVWNVVSVIKQIIVHLLDAANDGIRTHTVKFMEMLVIAQTHKEEDSSNDGSGGSGRANNDFSLEDVPLTLKIARRRKLEDEAGLVFEEMIKYHESDHISSANLMTTMGALTNIAKCRPQFMSKVITALEMLQANLPPTLAKSQVSSVRKQLKNQLLALLKHPIAAEQFFTNITTLLTDLGASKEEVMKAMPAFEEVKKKIRKTTEKSKASGSSGLALGETRAKRPKDADEDIDEEDEEEDDDDDDDEEEENKQKVASKISRSQIESAVDITEKFILERMTPALATELVMRSMSLLPREIPPQFHNTYTPIAAAGTEGQVKHVSRLLATQLTAAKLGPGMDSVRKAEAEAALAAAAAAASTLKIEGDPEEGSSNVKISTVIAGSITQVGGAMSGAVSEKTLKRTLQPAGMSGKKSRGRTMNLADLTHPLSVDENKSLMCGALQRILSADRTAKVGGVQEVRFKILTALAVQFPPEMKSILLSYIFQDIKSHSDFAFSWLYEEYCFQQGFNRAASMFNKRNDDTEYNSILCHLIRGVINGSGEGKERENLLRRLYLEAPIITEDAIQLLKQFIQIEGTAIAVVNLMKDLVMRRPTKKLNLLYFLLEFCSHEIVQVRETASETVLQLHADGDFNDIIENYADMYLRFLLSPSPPLVLFGEDRGRAHAVHVWTEDIIKVCLYLYLSLLPQNLKLFQHLAEVYVATTGDIKRTILRMLDASVRNIDMANPDLLSLIETCPEGSETLVTRVIHILTDKARPPPELVEKVRDLYERRVSDVRFLIPVLNGLKKQEVISVLPKLISLSPIVVKDVFSRLLGSGGSGGASGGSGPMSPSDLLIALHNVDATKCDMKNIIKAITLCFQEKPVFTQEVLAIVLQQLMEQPTIPILFMRSVIQAVGIYPRLIKFVMNILQRLILKQIWNIPKIWDGFIRCCERTVPHSYAIVLQLPPPQLRLMLAASPDMREPLLEHVQSFTVAERAHVSGIVMEVLYNADVIAAAAAAAPMIKEEEEEGEEEDPEQQASVTEMEEGNFANPHNPIEPLPPGE